MLWSDQPGEDVECVPGSDRVSDERGFELVWEQWRLPMVQLAVMLVGAREVAEDVVQEAFTGLHRRWASVDNPPGYLRVSVINGCHSVWRRRRTAQSHVSYWDPPAGDASAPVLIAEEHREVMRALHRLPRRQREVLILKYWQDLDDGQIAAVLSISESSVRATVSRARKALGSLLKDQ